MEHTWFFKAHPYLLNTGQFCDGEAMIAWQISSFFCFCNKTPWPRKKNYKGVYFGLPFQRFRVHKNRDSRRVGVTDRGRRLRVHILNFKPTVSSESKPEVVEPLNFKLTSSCGNVSHPKPSSQTTSCWVQILDSTGTFQIQTITQVHIQGSLCRLKWIRHAEATCAPAHLVKIAYMTAKCNHLWNRIVSVLILCDSFIYT